MGPVDLSYGPIGPFSYGPFGHPHMGLSAHPLGDRDLEIEHCEEE